MQFTPVTPTDPGDLAQFKKVEIGTEVEVGKLDGHIKRLPAKIVAFPHYDPEKKRPRS